jgi:SAM-dependent methyltransferase
MTEPSDPPPFDQAYWETHWEQATGSAPGAEVAPNPYLARELSGLAPGTALDAGCGEGAEAIWLAAAGWVVTAVDISSRALSRAAAHAANAGAPPERLEWVEADLSVWEPDRAFDLVTTHYAHPAGSQLAFYERLAPWVAPGGTLLIVGHRHTQSSESGGHVHAEREHAGLDHADHDHHPPAEASVTAARITAVLDPAEWEIVTADEPSRTLTDRGGATTQLDDVVVRATRRADGSAPPAH